MAIAWRSIIQGKFKTIVQFPKINVKVIVTSGWGSFFPGWRYLKQFVEVCFRMLVRDSELASRFTKVTTT